MYVTKRYRTKLTPQIDADLGFVSVLYIFQMYMIYYSYISL